MAAGVRWCLIARWTVYPQPVESPTQMATARCCGVPMVPLSVPFQVNQAVALAPKAIQK